MRTVLELSAITAQIEQRVASRLLPCELAAQFEQGKISKHGLADWAKRIQRLSDDYVRGTPAPIRSQEDAKAYASYYLPINLFKILRLLDEIPADFHSRQLRILDYGCGPGTGAIAALQTFPAISELHLVDASPCMLEVARSLLPACGECCSGTVTFTDPHTLQGSYDLIIAANVFNELGPQAQTELCTRLTNALSPGGAILFLEPALHSQTRRLLELRDYALRETPQLKPIFPCTRSDACPMLRKSATDWCHGTLSWETPPLVHQLDEILGFNKHRLKYAALILQLGAVLRNGLRIIGTVQKAKGVSKALACGHEFYGDLMLRKRDRTEQNRKFEHADWYDLVDIDDINDSGYIAATARVR